MKKLVKDLEGFPLERTIYVNHSVPQIHQDRGFNEALELIGNLEQELETLDEKEIDNITTDVLIDWDEDKNLLLSLRTINELSAKISKAICQKFGTSAVGTGKQDWDRGDIK